MKKYSMINVLNVAVIIGMILFGFAVKSYLPAIIPTKFDESGVAIKFAPVILSIFFLPIVASLTLFLLVFFVKRNSDFWNKEKNKIAVAQTNLGILLLVACLYVGTFLNALNFIVFYKYSFFAIGIGLFFILSSIPMKNIERNLMYGIRLPWTLTSANNWAKTHELTCKLMQITGIILILVGLVTKNHALILSLVGITFIVPMFYSYKIKDN